MTDETLAGIGLQQAERWRPLTTAEPGLRWQGDGYPDVYSTLVLGPEQPAQMNGTTVYFGLLGVG